MGALRGSMWRGCLQHSDTAHLQQSLMLYHTEYILWHLLSVLFCYILLWLHHPLWLLVVTNLPITLFVIIAHYTDIIMGKSPASRLFTQQFIQTQIKEKIKAPRHWPLCRKFTGDRWIPRTNGQSRGKCFHLTTSSCSLVLETTWVYIINYARKCVCIHFQWLNHRSLWFYAIQ